MNMNQNSTNPKVTENPIAIIAVRLGSSRLPGKAMMPILGKPMIELMIDRVSRSRHLRNNIIIATTEDPSDDPLEDLASRLRIKCFRGEKDNVLGRINAAINKYGGDPIVELLGDNPLVHAELIDDVINYYFETGSDYAATLTNEYPKAAPELKRFPIGIRVQVFSSKTLQETASRVKDAQHQEHSTSFIYENPEIFNIEYYECKDKWAKVNYPDYTFAVNYQKNFDLISTIFENLTQNNPDFSIQSLFEYIEKNPQLLALMGQN